MAWLHYVTSRRVVWVAAVGRYPYRCNVCRSILSQICNTSSPVET